MLRWVHEETVSFRNLVLFGLQIPPQPCPACSTHAVMHAVTLSAVRMPNREGFVSDPRPDVGPHE